MKVNNVIDKNLTFKFNGHPINTGILYTILLIVAVVGYNCSYLLFIVAFMIIAAVLLDMLSICAISFDNDNIIIKNRLKKHIICYTKDIRISIIRDANSKSRIYKQIAGEKLYKYNLVINDGYEDFILVSATNDSIAQEITKFIENFSFEENIEKYKKQNIRFARKIL